jgi:hypothetical protein
MGYTMEMTQANVAKMHAQLKQWGVKLDDLIAEAEEAGAEATNDYHERIADLKSKHQLAEAKLHELKTAGSEKWETLKVGLETAWSQLESAIEKLAN